MGPEEEDKRQYGGGGGQRVENMDEAEETVQENGENMYIEVHIGGGRSRQEG